VVLINDNWEEVKDLEDVSKIIREYFNEDLAYEMDKMIPEHIDEEYWNLEWQLEEKDGDITSLEDENDTLKNRIEVLEEKIEELEEKLYKCK
jgi:peptidoglycan hydrolase CwlO-like protein